MKKPSDRPVYPLEEVLQGRRVFCQTLVVGALGGASGCINFGELSDRFEGDGGAPDPSTAAGDLSSRPMIDATPPADLGGGQACQAGVSDTLRTAGTFGVNTGTFFAPDLTFVCRDAEGLFALTAICTHAGCSVDFANTAFSCHCHGSAYDFNGNVTRGPAPKSLVHYAMCVTPGGTVGYDVTTTVDAAVRYNF